MPQDISVPAEADCRDRPVRMGVASSLREIAEAIVVEAASGRAQQASKTSGDPSPSGAAGIHVETVLGASSVLARQIRLGAPIDILVSADAELVDALARRGKVLGQTRREVARGRLVLMANPRTAEAGSTPAYQALEQILSQAGSRFAIPSPAVPLGRYAHAWLQDAGALDALRRRTVLTEHARATLAAVDQGHVDAAILYASDARLARRAQIVATIPEDQHPAIRYVLVHVADRQSCPEIASVSALWLAPENRRRLQAAGFLVARPVASTASHAIAALAPNGRRAE